jgi:hypothetical protein
MKGSHRRSFLWRFVFFGLPLVAFFFVFKEASTWDLPRGGPIAVNEDKLAAGYRSTTIILAAVAAIPYLGLLLRFSDRLKLTEETIQRRRLLTNRTLHWEDVIEYESYPNYIRLAPAKESSGLYIDYFMTFNKHKALTRFISRRCREVDANMMSRGRRPKLILCDFGLVPTAVFMIAAALLVFFLRQRIVLLGVLSGIAMTIVSAWIWVTTHRRPERWRSGGFIYMTIFLLVLVLPPAYFAQGLVILGWKTLGFFGILYIVGLVAGSGSMAALLPSRKRKR